MRVQHTLACHANSLAQDSRSSSGKELRAIADYKGEDSLLILPVEQINIHTQVISRSRSEVTSFERPILQPRLKSQCRALEQKAVDNSPSPLQEEMHHNLRQVQ